MNEADKILLFLMGRENLKIMYLESIFQWKSLIVRQLARCFTSLWDNHLRAYGRRKEGRVGLLSGCRYKPADLLVVWFIFVFSSTYRLRAYNGH